METKKTELSFEEREKEYKRRSFYLTHGYEHSPNTYSARHGAYGRPMPSIYPSA